MSSLWIAIVSWIVVILLTEAIMWWLFHRKYAQICLPDHGDVHVFHLFTMWRLRLMVLLHTFFLVAVIIIAYLLLWP